MPAAHPSGEDIAAIAPAIRLAALKYLLDSTRSRQFIAQACQLTTSQVADLADRYGSLDPRRLETAISTLEDEFNQLPPGPQQRPRRWGR